VVPALNICMSIAEPALLDEQFMRLWFLLSDYFKAVVYGPTSIGSISLRYLYVEQAAIKDLRTYSFGNTVASAK
jgi:hypothetical protein